MDVLTTPPLPLAEWLSVVEREYLSEFVPSGGAAVKLAILDDDAIGTAAESLWSGSDERMRCWRCRSTLGAPGSI